MSNACFSKLVVGCFLISSAGCADKDEEPVRAGSIGATCDSEAGCTEPLLCANVEAADVCTYPAGAECQPDDTELVNGGCAANAECFVEEGTAEPRTGRCLLLEGESCDPKESFCTTALRCAEMASEGYRCFAPVLLVGRVLDSGDGSGISQAHVIGIDAEGSAATSVAQSDPNGDYSLELPVARNDDGSPIAATFTLNGSAQDYQPFPAGVRVALPITTEDAEEDDAGWVIDTALTDIALIPLPAAERYSISGTVRAATLDDNGKPTSDISGVLVVAGNGEQLSSATTDKDGAFTIFNVESGDYDIRAYASGIQVTAVSETVDDSNIDGVILQEDDRGTVTVSGNVQIVNAAGGSLTSVILVVEDTFNSQAARGEVPRGLRAPRSGAPDVSGDFEISGVPDGSYVVLAAYENDDLVRDPDTNIAGTDFVIVNVDASAGATLALSEAFKVTAALNVFGPGNDGPELVTSAPTLRWADDSSEDWYEVRVFDAFGNEAWANLDVPSVSGNGEVSVEYGGPLEPGMYYQFRVQSWRQPGGGDAAPISATEDLRGVFYRPAP